MNKKIYAIALAIFIVMPLLAAATLRVQAQSTPSVSLLNLANAVPNNLNIFANISAPNTIITLTLYAGNVSALWSWKVNMTWDNTFLQLANVTEGPFLSTNGASTTLFLEAPPTMSPPTASNIPELSDTLLENTSVTGSGALATISFTPLQYGNTTISLTNIEFLNPSGIMEQAPTTVTTVVDIHFPGDVLGINVVNMADVILSLKAFGSYPGNPRWNPACDILGVGKIDMGNVIAVLIHFGQHYP
jgi:hypothetical protein